MKKTRLIPAKGKSSDWIIKQIIPAPGVSAKFKSKEEDDDEEEETKFPLVCWALCEKHEAGQSYTAVIGMILVQGCNFPRLVTDDEEPGFLEYEYDDPVQL